MIGNRLAVTVKKYFEQDVTLSSLWWLFSCDRMHQERTMGCLCLELGTGNKCDIKRAWQYAPFARNPADLPSHGRFDNCYSTDGGWDLHTWSCHQRTGLLENQSQMQKQQFKKKERVSFLCSHVKMARLTGIMPFQTIMTKVFMYWLGLYNSLTVVNRRLATVWKRCCSARKLPQQRSEQ